MCIMIKKPANTHFDYNDIADFWNFNSDGLGAMWLESGVVRVEKVLAKSASEAWDFYKAHADMRDCAIHFRLRTHGNVDVDTNCHPYEVVPGIYMMQNGVLATGNAGDRTKSDTWHYARDFLAPMLAAHPELLRNAGFHALLSSHIGTGNRFVLMDKDGLVIINEHHGVEYKGAWMSNTYAWTDPTAPKYSWIGGSARQEEPRAGLEYYDPLEEVEPDWRDEAVDYFFGLLEDAGLWAAYNQLTYRQVDDAAAELGENAFWFLCDLIFDGPLTDAEVVRYINNLEDFVATQEESTPVGDPYDYDYAG